MRNLLAADVDVKVTRAGARVIVSPAVGNPKVDAERIILSRRFSQFMPPGFRLRRRNGLCCYRRLGGAGRRQSREQQACAGCQYGSDFADVFQNHDYPIVMLMNRSNIICIFD